MTMRSIAIVLAMLAPSVHGINLVRDGRPTATVVVADEASRVAEYAASELREHVFKATGAELPLARASEVEPWDENLVLVGPSVLTEALGLYPETLPSEGYLVWASPERLILMGRDRPAMVEGAAVWDPLDFSVETGTLWAVYEFLDRKMGVRWLWPGEDGTVTPARETLRVEDTMIATAPRLALRRIDSSVDTYRGGREIFDRKGLDYDTWQQMVTEWKVWARRHRLGGAREVHFDPAPGNTYARYQEEHPHWFAMRPDGRRAAHSRSDRRQAKFCVSNPAVIGNLYQIGLEALDSDLRLLSFSATPTPGEGYCLCPECRAMDDELGRRRTYTYHLGDGRQVEVPWVTMTRRYATVWNTLADRLAQDRPDRYVGVWPQGAIAAPEGDVTLRPNIIVARSGFNYIGHSGNESFRQGWANWERTGARMFLRSHFFEPGHGFPFLYAREMGRDFQFCAERAMIGAHVQTWRGHFATQGLNLYVLARMMADPSRGPGGIVSEYVRGGFGRAASPIMEYFDLCERLTRDLAETGFPSARSEKYAHYGRLFGPEFVREARVLFFRARQMEDDPRVLERIDFLEEGLKYAEKTGSALLKHYEMAVSGKDPELALQVIADREAFMARHGRSWAIHVPTLRWDEWDPSKSGYFGLDALEDLGDKNVFAVLADWKFNLDPENIGEKEGWCQPKLDTRDWVSIKAGDWWESQGFGGGPNRTDIEGGYDGVAWYRKEVDIPEDLEGKKIFLRFGAIDESGWVYVNGEQVAESVFHPRTNPEAWVTPVEAEITDNIHFGRPNVISVRVRNDYGAGGLWRLVTLHWAD